MTGEHEGGTTLSRPDQLLHDFDGALAGCLKAVIDLRSISLDDQSLLGLHGKLLDREKFVGQLLSNLKELSFIVGSEKYHRWRTQERFYVYVSHRYGKPIEASLGSLGEASGSSWHNLLFAARHWQRMERINDRPSRRTGETHYSIMAYDPVSGQIRKLSQPEIDAALIEPERKPT